MLNIQFAYLVLYNALFLPLSIYFIIILQPVGNNNSINIEICVNPDSDYDTARKNCIELVKQIMRETGIDANHVIRHYDAKRKHCPRKMLDTPQLGGDFKAALTRPETPAESEKKSGW